MWIKFGEMPNMFEPNRISMKKKILIILIIVAAIAIPVGIYTISPLFISSTVNEPPPVTPTTLPTTIPREKTLSGVFTGVGDGFHNAQGNVSVVSLGDGSKILRLENFKSTNGPNVHVYLSTDKRATDFVDLGNLKANNGNQNYNIPVGTDITKHNIVLIWCKDFSVLFGSATLMI
jgi:hypothetical protein